RLVALRPRHAQRLGGQRVDLAGHAARPRGDVAAGLPRELARPVAARRGDPMVDVAPDLRDRQRLEPRAHRDALPERAQRAGAAWASAVVPTPASPVTGRNGSRAPSPSASRRSTSAPPRDSRKTSREKAGANGLSEVTWGARGPWPEGTFVPDGIGTRSR